MGDTRDGLRWAGEVGAAPGYFPFFLHDGVAAGGAQPFRGFQDAVGPGVLRAFGKVHFQNGRDDFPAFSTSTVSPMRTSFRSISSWLWRVARATVEPDSSTGCNSATGVSTPVRPTCTTIFSRVVSFCSGEFIRRRPAGRASRSSQRFPRSRGADFNNGSVRAVGERMAEPVNIPHGLAGGFQAVRVIHRLIAGDAAMAEHVPEVFCVPEFRAFIRAQSVGQKASGRAATCRGPAA